MPPAAVRCRPGTSPPATARPCWSATGPAAAASACWRRSAFSPATDTACSPSTCSATARAAATRTGSATTPSRRSTPRWTGSRAAPTSIPPGSAPSARRSAARCCSRRRPASRGCSAVVSDGAKRPQDDHSVDERPLHERALAALMLHAPRAIAGTQAAPSLDRVLPRIAPRPVLLIAAGGEPGGDPGQPPLPRGGGSDCRAVRDPRRRPHVRHVRSPARVRGRG